MFYVGVFLLWTLMIYWCHRLAHIVPVISDIHRDHHKQIADNTFNGLHWSNLFLYFDSWKSTADQWVTEVIPTFMFAWLTDQWWMFGLYYVWAAFMQEAVEHNPKFNAYPFITSGKWHLVHHADNSKNFGVFFPIWDIVFGTSKNIGNRK